MNVHNWMNSYHSKISADPELKSLSDRVGSWRIWENGEGGSIDSITLQSVAVQEALGELYKLISR